MSKLKEYKQYFKPDEVPEALAKLIEFAENPPRWFSHRFQLQTSFDDAGSKTYSDKPEFLNSLFDIAQASSSGSSGRDMAAIRRLERCPDRRLRGRGRGARRRRKSPRAAPHPDVGWGSNDRLGPSPLPQGQGFRANRRGCRLCRMACEELQVEARERCGRGCRDHQEMQEIHEAAFQEWLKQFCE